MLFELGERNAMAAVQKSSAALAIEPKAVQLSPTTGRTNEPSPHGKWARSTRKLRLLSYVTPTLGECSR